MATPELPHWIDVPAATFWMGSDPPESLPDYPRRRQDGPEPVDAYPSRHPWDAAWQPSRARVGIFSPPRFLE